MSTQVRFRRGTTVQTSTFTGAGAEVTVDTTKNICVVHDGITAGGYPLLLENGTNSALSPGSLSSCALKFANDPNTGIISPGLDQLALVTGGVARLSVDSAGSIAIPGNVTITGSLTVNGGVNASDILGLIVALS
jgi:Major tropism determinant N-terminal domain